MASDVARRAGSPRAFRIVAAVLGAATIGLTVPFAVIAFVDDAQTIHRMHFVAGAFGSGVLLGVALLVCALRPSAIGPFRVAFGAGVASTIAGLISGDFVSGLWFLAPIVLVVLVALHPTRGELIRPEGVDPATVVLAIVALIPAVAFSLTQAELQRGGVATDPHAELHHYSGMVSYALGVALGAAGAALRVPEHRVGVRIVAVSAAGLGASSLWLSSHAGAFDAVWAWLAIAWGVMLVAATELRADRT